MTPEQFNDLEESEQAETVWDGVQVAERFYRQFHVLLYKIDNLYVEVFYHEDHNYIRKFNAFDKYKLLDVYLERLDKL